MPQNPRDSTAVLVEAARAGDNAAWAELNDIYRPYLLLVCARVPAHMRSRFDPEDVVQSVFLAAFQQLSNFRYKNEAGFKAWLKEIATNQMHDRIKANDRDKRASASESQLETPELVVNNHSDGETPSRILSLAESESGVLAAIAKLPKDQQELIWMREFENKTFPDMAKALGQPETTVRRRHKECYEALLRLLE